MNNYETNDIKHAELIEQCRKTFLGSEKTDHINEKYFKKALNELNNDIANGNDKYICAIFLIYILEICDYYKAMMYLKNIIDTHNFNNIDIKAEIVEVYDKFNNHKVAKKEHENYLKIVKIKNENRWQMWNCLEIDGTESWLKRIVFEIKTQKDFKLIEELQNEIDLMNINAVLPLGEIYEYFGDWNFAYELYEKSKMTFDPVSQSEVEIMKKINLGMRRCYNMQI